MRGVSRAELARDPVGHYVSGTGFAHGCLHPALWVLSIWGRPDEAVAYALGRSLVIELAPPAVPHGSFIDVSGLEAGETGAFRALEAYLTHYAEPLSRSVLRIALVRPSGLMGAIVSGAFEVAPRPFPVRLFDDALGALSWLHAEQPFEPEPRAALTELEAMRNAAAGIAPIVRELSAVLASDLTEASIERAAKQLGVSPRTLQRRLGEAGTTFQHELADARIRAAQRLLLDTDAPITAVAYDVGCGTPQRLSALFKERTGETPSAWRKARRR